MWTHRHIGSPTWSARAPFLEALGMTFETVEPGRVVAWIDLGLGPGHAVGRSPWRRLHHRRRERRQRRALAVLARGQFASRVNNNTDFLRPVVHGRVQVVAEPVLQGSTQQLWQVTITRKDDGKAIARGQVRQQNLEPPG